MFLVTWRGNAQTPFNYSVNITSQEGLLSNVVYSIIQDQKGYIWMGTSNGLSRYDGYEFRNYDRNKGRPPHLQDIVVTGIEEDTVNHALWLTNTKSTISCFDLDRQEFVVLGEKTFTTPYPVHLMTRYGFWLGNSSEVLRFSRKGNSFKAEDFTHLINEPTEDTGSTYINICNDGHENTWMTKGKKAARISQEGKTLLLQLPARTVSMTTSDDYCMILDERMILHVFDASGKQKKEIPISKEKIPVASLRGMTVWNGQLILFASHDTFLINTLTGTISPLLDTPLTNGKLVDKDKETLYISNSDGRLWRFTKTWKMRNWQLTPSVVTNYTARDVVNVIHIEDGTELYSTYGGGLYLYDPAKDIIRRYQNKDKYPLIRTNFLRCMMRDKSGCLWISEDFLGISKVFSSHVRHRHHTVSNDTLLTDKNSIRCFAKVNDNEIWMSNMSGDLLSYSLKNEAIENIRSYRHKVYAIGQDRKGRMWIGTRGEGLYIDDRHISMTDGLPSNDIYDFVTTDNGTHWIATFGGGLTKAVEKDNGEWELSVMLTESKERMNVHDLEIASDGTLWVAAEAGLFMIDRQEKIHHLVESQNMICLLRAANGTIWAGAAGGGVFECSMRKGKRSFENFTTEQGLINNNVKSITQAASNVIVVATEDGVSFINTDSHTINNEKFSNNALANIYHENSCLKLDDGSILLGNHNGFQELLPLDRLQSKETPFRIQITDILVNASSIFATNDSIRLRKGEKGRMSLELNHQQNNIEFTFSDFFYNNISSILFSYYMEGVDDGWSSYSTDNSALYRNLPPGHYVFHVKQKSEGNDLGQQADIEVIIRQPWWNSWWAWIIYAIIITAIIVFILHLTQRSIRLHNALNVEKKLHAFRLEFFTNVSHEFRTPLTLIQGATSTLTAGTQVNVPRGTLQSIRRGTNRMMRLINELMQFRTVTTGNEVLHVSNNDIVLFARRLFDDFRSTARNKELNLTFLPSSKSILAWFDKEKMETIIYNLLSQAVSHTPSGGSVAMRISVKEGQLVISVDDTANVTEEEADNMFKPFSSRQGIGIGLYISQQLTHLHKGNLSFERLTPDGSRLTLHIPAGEEAYTEEEKALMEEAESNNPQPLESHQEDEYLETPQKPINDKLLLIVENDQDIVNHVIRQLSGFMKTATANSAEEGMRMAKEQVPDLIMTAINLPGKDGYELTRDIRETMETRHIPIIQMSDYDDDEHYIKGIRSGADRYLVKPFSNKLLRTVVFNIMTRQTIPATFPEKTGSASAEPIDTKGKDATVQSTGVNVPESIEGTDKSFLTKSTDRIFETKLKQIVSEHLDEYDFDANKLAGMMHYSRSRFNEKTKLILGCTAAEYIKEQRLTRAARLVREQNLRVPEIADRCGFSHVSYFYKIFKARFGMSPTDYANMSDSINDSK